jgi:tetratricopeptide (TPR) repeat protein
MRRCLLLIATIFFCVALGVSQQDSNSQNSSQAPPRSDQQKSTARDAEAHESSSRDTRIDLSPPKNDVKDHPDSGAAVSGNGTDPEDDTGDVNEMHPWNPYRAGKDDEVGDYYFRQKNYKAALARYQDALIYKEHDAFANFRMAQCYEKLNQPDEAVTHYKEYLKILPNGEFSKDAKKALAKLGVPESQITQKTVPKP